jgi:hypothetical protein
MEIVTKEEFENYKRTVQRELDELKEKVSAQRSPKLMKNKDLKEYLGCSYTTIDKMREQNVIPYKKVMGNYYYSFEEVNRVFTNTGGSTQTLSCNAGNIRFANSSGTK